MGAPNGLTPADVGRLTREQLASWWAGPMRAAQRAGDGEQAPSGDPLADFVRQFSPILGAHPRPWWEAKFAEWKEEQARGEPAG